VSVRFSIIIPVRAINAYVRENVPHIQGLTTPSWELIILPNDAEPNIWNDEKIKVISSGAVGPAKKRDLGAAAATGEILVFLDDDSYPEPNLLCVAEKHFSNDEVVALGGPAMTPPDNSFWQRVSGAVFLSKFSGGAPERYVPLGKPREITDWPSVNLMVRRTEFLEIGGFNSPYWPGEDTKLCLDLIQKTKKKIIYVPEMLVWHHRRAGLAAHLKQIGGYGLHRGYFAKKYPENSRKATYFAPSAFLIFCVLSLFSGSLPYPLKDLIGVGWCLYGLALLVSFSDMLKYESAHVALAALGYAFLTHIYYGYRFIRGLLTPNLVSELRK
jgi:GT2 family glycosyltransferase